MVKFKNFENVITFLEKIIDRILFMMDLNVNLYLLPEVSMKNIGNRHLIFL